MALMPTKTELDPQRLVVAWQSFTGPAGSVQAENELRASDPRVVQAAANFCELSIPREERPNVLDRSHAMTKAAAEAAEAQRAAEFEQQAKQHRIRLAAPMTYRLRRDVVASRDGVPSLIEKGSVVLQGDPLLAEFSDEFGAV